MTIYEVLTRFEYEELDTGNNIEDEYSELFSDEAAAKEYVSNLTVEYFYENCGIIINSAIVFLCKREANEETGFRFNRKSIDSRSLIEEKGYMA